MKFFTAKRKTVEDHGLKVAQELSNVRQSIEQINAQIKSLQNQIAYSTISLKLEQSVNSFLI